MPHTSGNWKLGKQADTVVSDFHHNYHGYDREDKEYYGGYLIAESIGTDADRQLISAAPDMLAALEEVLKFHDDKIHDLNVWTMARKAIAKAKGEI